jgi:Immunoglobulin I-set domain.
MRAETRLGHQVVPLLTVPPRIGPFTFGELIEGVRTQVQCVIQAGDPPLSLRWLKDGGELPLELGIQVMQDDFSITLAIPRVSRAHAGNYTCLAGNPAKTASVTARLVVSGNVTTRAGVRVAPTAPAPRQVE